MNLLSSIYNPLKYNSNNTAPPPTLPTPNILFNFENSSTNEGSDGGNLIISNGTYYKYNNANVKNGSYSLQVVGASGNRSGGCFYPSSGNYSWNTTNGITISFWFRTNNNSITTANGYPNIFYHNSNGFPGRIGMQFQPGSSNTTMGTLSFIFGQKASGVENEFPVSTSTYLNSPYNLNLSGSWNHIGWSIDNSGNWLLTINGQQITGSSRTINFSSLGATSPICFGQEGTSGTYPKWNGNIDCFRVYNSNLTLTQLQYLYSSGQ